MNRHGYRNLFMLVLITLYVAGTGFIVLYGARFYRDMVARSNENLQVRTAFSFCVIRLLQYDDQGTIEVRDDSIRVFVQEDCFIRGAGEDGYLVEQNSLTDEIMVGASQKIARLSDISFTTAGNTITVTFSDDQGEEHSITYTLMSEGVIS